MLDLAYVLLVVFIIMTTASIQGLNINLPKPSKTIQTEQALPHVIQINEKGQLFLDGAGKTLFELETALINLRERDSQVHVLIKGNRSNQYEQIMVLIDLCDRLHVNMGLVTARIGT